jgi:hypothetical protein
VNKLMVIFTYVYVFIFIFTPSSIFSFNILYLIFFCSLLINITNSKVLLIIWSHAGVKVLLILFSSFFLYVLVQALLFDSSDLFYRLYSMVLYVIFSTSAAISCLALLNKLNMLTPDRTLKFFINVFIIQFFFVLLGVIIPEFRMWVLENAQNSEKLLEVSDHYGVLRSYGFAKGYTNTLSLSFFVLFTLLFIRFKPMHIIIVFLVFLGISLNAVAGFAGIILYTALYLTFYTNSKNKLLIILVTVFSVFLLNNFMISAFEDTLAGESPFYKVFIIISDVVKLILDGDSSGTFSFLSDMVVIPEGATSLIFGTGVNIFDLPRGTNSDIGYFVDLNLLGLGAQLFWCSINIAFFSLLFYYTSSFGCKTSKCAFYSILFSFPIFYLKGNILYSNEFTHILMLLVFSGVVFKMRRLISGDAVVT